MSSALTQARCRRSARCRHHDPRGDWARGRAPLHPRSSNRLSVAGATPHGWLSVAEPKIPRRSTLCGPNSRCDHAGRAAAALDSAPNQSRSTARCERRERACAAEFFALAFVPAPVPTTLKALDHSLGTKPCTSHLQTAAASTQQQQRATWSTKLERTSAPPFSSFNAAQRTSDWQPDRNEGLELHSCECQESGEHLWVSRARLARSASLRQRRVGRASRRRWAGGGCFGEGQYHTASLSELDQVLARLYGVVHSRDSARSRPREGRRRRHRSRHGCEHTMHPNAVS